MMNLTPQQLSTKHLIQTKERLLKKSRYKTSEEAQQKLSAIPFSEMTRADSIEKNTHNWIKVLDGELAKRGERWPSGSINAPVLLCQKKRKAD